MVYPTITNIFYFVVFNVLVMVGETLPINCVHHSSPTNNTVKERGRGGEDACVTFYAEWRADEQTITTIGVRRQSASQIKSTHTQSQTSDQSLTDTACIPRPETVLLGQTSLNN